MTTAYIALGSNLGDPAEQLKHAVDGIAHWQNSRITAISSVYSSSAVGPGKQNDYLNAVIALTTQLSALELLQQLQAQENRQGRVRTERWGARTVDLDIVLYGRLQLDTETLTIPHPAMAQRHFVLYPLAEIAGPEYTLPDDTVLATLLKHCPRGELKKTRTVLCNTLETRC